VTHNSLNMRVALYVIVGLAAAVVLLLFFDRHFVRSSAYDRYVCTRCGLQRFDYIRKLGPITTRHRQTYEESAVSRALQVTQCGHNWLLYRWDHSSKRLLVGGSGQGSCQSLAVRSLLEDDQVARELARMPSPSRTWDSLLAALNSSRTFDEDFLKWRQASNGQGLATWAATNGSWILPANH
jgi:hypothetical protein